MYRFKAIKQFAALYLLSYLSLLRSSHFTSFLDSVKGKIIVFPLFFVYKICFSIITQITSFTQSYFFSSKNSFLITEKIIMHKSCILHSFYASSNTRASVSADSFNFLSSSSFNGSSIIFSTPFSPITAGIPRQTPSIPY